MRKVRGSLFVSLDGVIQAAGGPSEDPTGGFAIAPERPRELERQRRMAEGMW